ncbi:cystatin-2-like [Ornithodoros turicata]|uniref:Putative cystatin-2 n=1 Tax=Ornithodoros turicata TaxID=34597 RepID=A0A2R5LN06_9ACAR
MAYFGVASVLLFAIFHGSQGSSMPGGWTKQDPKADARFLELAHFATSSQTEGLQYYNTVVELVEVETQVVAGMNYKLKMAIAPSTCKIGEVQYSVQECVAQEGQPQSMCVAVVYDVPWQKQTSVTSFKCEQAEQTAKAATTLKTE